MVPSNRRDPYSAASDVQLRRIVVRQPPFMRRRILGSPLKIHRIKDLFLRKGVHTDFEFCVATPPAPGVKSPAPSRGSGIVSGMHPQSLGPSSPFQL
jgi:hypothetical protein